MPKLPAVATAYTDGASRNNPGPASVGVVVLDEQERILVTISEYLGKQTNNVAEYQALIRCLEVCRDLGIKELAVNTDSQLMERQVNGHWRVKDQRLGELHARVKELAGDFNRFQLQHVRRKHNKAADELANEALDRQEEGLEPYGVMMGEHYQQAAAPGSQPANDSNLVVAFQGQLGAFSHMAVEQLLPGSTPLACTWFDDVFEALDAGQADLAVLPVENSQAGTVREVYDLLLSSSYAAVAGTALPIHHQLLALPGSTLADIDTVMSHPQALAQCHEFTRQHGWTVRTAEDTAGSARQVHEQQLQGVAAIASERAASLYDLDILASNIESNDQNMTRFVVLAPLPGDRSLEAVATATDRALAQVNIAEAAPYKTMLALTLANKPGALFWSLAGFAEHGIDLHKLESRPDHLNPWDYVFYLECGARASDPLFVRVLDELSHRAQSLHVLGSFPVDEPH